MKINEIGCESFAGLSDERIQLSEGLNIIEGANETGKTTLMDLAYSVLFQGAKVGKKETEDKSFRSLYYPSTASGSQGDPEGYLSFEGAAGKYTLRKEWGSEGAATLRTPEGLRVKDPEEIARILQEELGYSQATYRELVFSSQRRPISAVVDLLGQSGKDSALADLSSQITQSVLETGGASLDAFKNGLDEKIGELDGNWDCKMRLPKGGLKRGLGNPWKKNNGRIVDAYYRKEETLRDYNRALELEKEYQGELEKRSEAERSRKLAMRALQEFSDAREAEDRRRGVLNKKGDAKARLDHARKEEHEAEERIMAREKALSEWPQLERKHARVEELMSQRAQAEAAEKAASALANARQAESALAQARAELPESAPTSGDEARVRELERAEEAARAQLKGLNIAATLSAADSATIELEELSSGKREPLGSGSFAIKEAVRICVPGVLELTLSPEGVDVEQLAVEVESASQERSSILDRFGAKDVAALRALAENAAEAERRLSEKERELQAALDGSTMEELEAACACNPVGEKTAQAVAGELAEFCKGEDPGVFKGKVKMRIELYAEKYGDLERLEQSLDDEKRGLEQARENVTKEQADLDRCERELQDAPEATCLSGIEDLDAHKKKLEKALEDCHEEYGASVGCVAAAEERLNQQPKSAEELSADLEDAERALEAAEKELEHWLHIRQTYDWVREQAESNPMTDVRDRFCRYLSEATDGGLELTDLSDSMSASITSGNSQLSWAIASEGTRDSISLAFRLALLDHLFPQGGGFLVLDDPFTDMDPARTKRACEMVMRFAERNQVIFTTCDPKYRELLPGANVIEWG